MNCRSVACIARQVGVEVCEEYSRTGRRFRLSVSDAVSDCHENGGRRTVSARVRDQDAEASAGQREKVVIVAAGALRGLVMNRDVEIGNSRRHCGQERFLDIRDRPQLVIDGVVGLFDRLRKHESLRRPREEIPKQHEIGNPVPREGIGVLACEDHHVLGRSLIEVRDG